MPTHQCKGTLVFVAILTLNSFLIQTAGMAMIGPGCLALSVTSGERLHLAS